MNKPHTYKGWKRDLMIIAVLVIALLAINGFKIPHFAW